MSTPSAPTAETNAANVATPTAVATVPPSTLITIKLPANKKTIRIICSIICETVVGPIDW